MKDTLARVMPQLMLHEGGFVDDPDDPGGATKYGITHKTLAAWRERPVTKADVKALEQDEAEAIYRARYWSVIRGDELPAGTDYVVFDAAVNSGPDRAIRILQSVIKAKVDGKLGPETMRLAQAMAPAVLVSEYSAARLSFLMNLKTWPKFGKGWTRRVNEVRALAMQLAQPAVILPTTPPQPMPDDPGSDTGIPASEPPGRWWRVALILAVTAALIGIGWWMIR